MKKKKPGFTLMEMIIVLALTVVVLGIVNAMFITGNKVFYDSDVKSTLQIEGQAVQEKISNITMQAKSVTPVNSTEMVVVSLDKDGKEQKFNINKDNNSVRIIKYDKDDNEIMPPQDIFEYVKELNIIYKPNETNPDSIDIKMELTKNSRFGSEVIHPINFSITFRNKGLS